MEKVETSGIVLDTDVLVSDLRGKTSFLKGNDGRDLATTMINAFELYYGAYKSKDSSANLSATGGLLSSLRVLGLGIQAAEGAGEVLAHAQRRGENIEIRDLLIGCIAREEGMSLITYNVKHFRKIPGLKVIDASLHGDK